MFSFQPLNSVSNLFSVAGFSGPLGHLNLWLTWCHLWLTWCHLCWFLYIKRSFLHQILNKGWPKKVMLGACRTVVWTARHSFSFVSDW